MVKEIVQTGGERQEVGGHPARSQEGLELIGKIGEIQVVGDVNQSNHYRVAFP